jgi:hypothetical protein
MLNLARCDGWVAGVLATTLLSWTAFPARAGDTCCPGHAFDDTFGCGKAQALIQREAAGHLIAELRDEDQWLIEFGLREPSEHTDLLHCDLELEILPSAYDNLDGANTMTIQSLVDGLTQFTFRLREQFVITAAIVNGDTPVDVDTISSSSRVVTLDRPYDAGEIFTLTIDYYGHAESRGFGSIEFVTHSGEPIVYTLSEAYFSYTWWPVKDGDYGAPGDNADKFTLDLAVTSPDSMMTASNGLLQSVEPLPNNRVRYRVVQQLPQTAPYLVCFSTTNYNDLDQWTTQALDGQIDAGALYYIYPEERQPIEPQRPGTRPST